MKKVLSLAVLMMVMLISVSGLAQVSDTVNVPVFLNVPAFVRLSVDTTSPDSQFDLVFDPANPANPTDTVKLLAEANVNYSVSSSIAEVTGYASWASLLQISIDTNAAGFGGAGNVVFDVTATLDVLGNLNLGALPTNTKIADVTFTIASI
ncbi:hypothetical protein X928_08215 [Petrotoga miotherma DSM 10691]|jgi:hypothetical protein|uniref:Cohesin domain-containing protein n=2 Tax=Petrotoga TaxID=28236 RepID=A9BGU7_PETMO|nr:MULTISPECIES: hypothetical protein [Petrotoga]ABX32528.1 hypothetical protein Pmob_1839 [Petrotoga mobilis SJ95]MBL5981235.1 hypothetical protein [Petrotoga sp. 8T1HF07.NaAc.6.1]PNR87872.1 hypothetical protein X925_07820 [Petrotoga sp. 9T1HF07.CasAA.8.2]PNR91329.1 hypothetical protein X926_09090 [Petrotoga sp. HWHPT.55.6.3]PNR99037.1 hypothetical protein X928_08215 [Petrotoga miotherma DSM 10691]